jgi:hypothetical protein
MGQDIRIVSLAAILLPAASPGYPASDLSGIWTLNRTKSNFGKVIPPEQLGSECNELTAAWRR